MPIIQTDDTVVQIHFRPPIDYRRHKTMNYGHIIANLQSHWQPVRQLCHPKAVVSHRV